MVAIANYEPPEVERVGEVVCVCIPGQYHRTVHVWDLWQVEADLRQMNHVSAADRLICQRRIAAMKDEFRRQIAEQDSGRKTLTDHVCEASLWLVITVGIFGIVWIGNWIW